MKNQQMEKMIKKKIRGEGAWGWTGNVRNAEERESGTIVDSLSESM